LYVADSALYSKGNLQTLSGLQWLTRVPLTVKSASELVATLAEAAFQASGLAGDRIASVCNGYGGVRQRWVVVESEAHRQSDLDKLEQTIAQAAAQGQSQLTRLQRQAFACEANALAALEQVAARLPWHHLIDLQVKPKAHYERPGKPTADTPPPRITYHPQATLTLKGAKQAQHQLRAADSFWQPTFWIPMPSRQRKPYKSTKGQQSAERGRSVPQRPLILCLQGLPQISRALLIEGMIFSEKGRTAPFLRKNHPWILQPHLPNASWLWPSSWRCVCWSIAWGNGRCPKPCSRLGKRSPINLDKGRNDRLYAESFSVAWPFIPSTSMRFSKWSI
jgi:hypothetical protein